MKRILFTILFTIAGSQTLAAAQTPADALATCVSTSMSNQDSVVTARWLFIAMSRHPALPQGARVSDSEGLDANRQMGALVNRMLFEVCASETRAAIQGQGRDAALEAAFNMFGQRAMTDLMGNPDVMASVIQLGAYVDQQRLNALTPPATQ